MSILRTEGTITDFRTGLPIITGLALVTESGLFISTAPVGEPPGGVNQTPGMDANAPGNDDPGVPYGFTPPVQIGPTQ